MNYISLPSRMVLEQKAKPSRFFLGSSYEQWSKPVRYFPLYWLFDRDPYFMVYEIIPT